jgi:hypothetical protein
MLTAETLKHELEKLRDELTDKPHVALVWPFGLDILANSGPILITLAARLNATRTAD